MFSKRSCSKSRGASGKMTLSRKERRAIVRTSIYVEGCPDSEDDIPLFWRLGDLALWGLGVRYNEEKRGWVCNGNNTLHFGSTKGSGRNVLTHSFYVIEDMFPEKVPILHHGRNQLVVLNSHQLCVDCHHSRRNKL